MLARRRFMTIAGAAVSAPMVARFALGDTLQTTLKLAHYASPLLNLHKKLLIPWAERIESESAGRIKFEMYPAMRLGGTPAQLYDQARDGVADIVLTLPGNTPGRFPGIEVFDLPFVPSSKSLANAQAVQAFYETHLRDEFRDVHPIALWAHDAGVIHTSKPVAKLEDLRGLKVRAPTRLSGEALKALGANGVPLPLPQVPEALAQHVIDGCVIPWEVVPGLKVQEFVKNHTEIPSNPTFYVTTFIVAMNKPKYESLPADLKAIIDANSGRAFAAAAGRMWDEQSAIAADQVRTRGNKVVTLSQDETVRWQKATQRVVDGWIKQVERRGLDGGKLIESARSLIGTHEVTRSHP